MKTIKAICLSLLALPLIAGFVSCSEDGAEYSSAQKLKNAQVYFSVDESSTLNVDKEATSTTLKIFRENTKGELSVPLTSDITGPMENVFNVPTSVTFADGQSEADITITYDADQVEYGQYDTLSVAINAADITTAYGPSEFNGLIGAAEPWTDWAFVSDYKTCAYQYNTVGANGSYFISGTETGCSYQVSESQLDPNQARIKVQNTYYGDLVLYWNKETNVVTLPQTFNATLTELLEQDIWLMDLESYSGNSNYRSSYDPKTGIVTLNIGIFISNGMVAYGTERILIDSDDFPRTDYSIQLAYTSTIVSPEGQRLLVISSKMGDDVDHANIALVPTSQINDQDVLQSIIDGDYPILETVENSGDITSTAFSNKNLKNNTSYVAMGVTFDAAGNAQETGVSTQFTYTTRLTSSWEEVYTGNYGYKLFWGYEGSDGEIEEYQAPYTVYQNVEDPTKFKIAHWFDLAQEEIPTYSGTDFTFTLAANGKILVDKINTGYYLESGDLEGFVKVSELKTYSSQFSDYQSYYDEDKGFFNFYLAYYVDDASLSAGNEFFYIDSPEAQASMRKAVAKAKKAAKAKMVYTKSHSMKIQSVNKSSENIRINKNLKTLNVINFKSLCK